MTAKKLTRLKNAASKLHTHTVVFAADTDDEECVALAFLGHTTKAIAKATGLSEGQVHYRIGKAGLVGERSNYRSGKSEIAQLVVRQCSNVVKTKVRQDIAPRFKGLAEVRVD
jgi:hypothetical protein